MAFYEKFKGTPKVIFYCQSSNGRGPRCAGWCVYLCYSVTKVVTVYSGIKITLTRITITSLPPSSSTEGSRIGFPRSKDRILWLIMTERAVENELNFDVPWWLNINSTHMSKVWRRVGLVTIHVNYHAVLLQNRSKKLLWQGALNFCFPDPTTFCLPKGVVKSNDRGPTWITSMSRLRFIHSFYFVMLISVVESVWDMVFVIV